MAENRFRRTNTGYLREYACGMIDWKRVPWPLWIYSVAMLLAASLLEVNVHGPVSARVLFRTGDRGLPLCRRLRLASLDRPRQQLVAKRRRH